MDISLTTMPAEAEVLAMWSVAEMRASLRISHTIEDDLMKLCILAAYDWLAGPAAWLNRPIINTTYTAYLPAFVAPLELPRPPLVSVTSMKYYLDGVLTTVSPSIYGIQTRGPEGFGSLILKPNQAWPDVVDPGNQSIELTYLAGFGTGAEVKTKYPALVRALMILANDYFRNREDTFIDIRMVEIDRKIVNDVETTAGRYKIYNRIV